MSRILSAIPVADPEAGEGAILLIDPAPSLWPIPPRLRNCVAGSGIEDPGRADRTRQSGATSSAQFCECFLADCSRRLVLVHGSGVAGLLQHIGAIDHLAGYDSPVLFPTHRLYKYCRREHYEALKDCGSLRIGTLYEYRSAELGERVSDSMDGAIPISGTAMMPPGSAMPGGSYPFHRHTKVTVENSLVVAPNRYVFCTSATYSREEQREWDRTQGYDVCYCIYFPEAFFGGISVAIAGDASFLAHVPVIYYKGEIDIGSPQAHLPPEMFKAEGKYGPQREVRAIWRPAGPVIWPWSKAPPLEALYRKVPQVGELCALVK